MKSADSKVYLFFVDGNKFNSKEILDLSFNQKISNLFTDHKNIMYDNFDIYLIMSSIIPFLLFNCLFKKNSVFKTIRKKLVHQMKDNVLSILKIIKKSERNFSFVVFL